MPVTIAMIEDDAPFAEALQRYFTLSKEVDCLQHHRTAEAALEALRREAPHVLLVDINLPGMSGIEFVGHIKDLHPQVLCLMLTMYEESGLIFDALKAGASGYLLKRTPPKEVVAAIMEAHSGGSPMSPEIARRVVSFFHQKQVVTTPEIPPASADIATLAPREVEVLDLLSKGYLYKEIGDQLGISTHTVNTHIRRIYEKLHVQSRGQAVAKYRGLAEQG
ncbi:response regulator transcription factor [Roseimicrobium sp. ORNL1]|uniref:response regulator transcription factor n=1 Tax=Roseimicrobium sp. ORNL1 TaxID=2711231 RepID=UPI0013E17405|nr:response regulator transcription factor [Roseimicrobium sp. ORNL1]QIF04685.1 response regulator transcription factor [Roseimicrobium sp. ORNL1]